MKYENPRLFSRFILRTLCILLVLFVSNVETNGLWICLGLDRSGLDANTAQTATKDVCCDSESRVVSNNSEGGSIADAEPIPDDCLCCLSVPVSLNNTPVSINASQENRGDKEFPSIPTIELSLPETIHNVSPPIVREANPCSPHRFLDTVCLRI